jgi:hypothetical protein
MQYGLFALSVGTVVAGIAVFQLVSGIERLEERVDRLQREVGICCGTERLPASPEVMERELGYMIRLRKDLQEIEKRLEALEEQFAASP